MPVVPVPVLVVDPTDSVTVQVPAAGKPLSATFPVTTAHVGCVIAPIIGAVGMVGDPLITALADGTDVQVETPSVTVNVYVPPARPLNDTVVPVPVMVVEPTESVTVQVPAAGKPLSATLPVATAHVGWVIVPITGAVGVAGCGFITAVPEAPDVQVVVPSVTVNE